MLVSHIISVSLFVYHYEEETLVFENDHFVNESYLVLERDISYEQLM